MEVKAAVQLDLAPSDVEEALRALRGVGIEATVISPVAPAPNEGKQDAEEALDAAVRASDADILLVDEERWAAYGSPSSIHPRLVIVLLKDESRAVATVLGSGAFDYILREGGDWAGRAASYIRALASLRRRLAGAFGALERRYEDLVHALPDIVYELDASGRFTFVNKSIRILGYEPADLIGKHFSVLLHEEDAVVVDRSAVLDMFRGTKTGAALSPKFFNERRSMERRTENLEVRLRRKPGSGSGQGDMIVTVLSYGEVTAAGEYSRRDGDPDFVGTVGVIRDITLRRKSEEMLRKLYQAVDQLSAGILIADRSFKIEYVNPGFFRISGYPPQEVLGAELFSFFAFEESQAEELRSQVKDGFDCSAEVRLAHPAIPVDQADGEAGLGGWTALHASPVRSPGGIVTHAILICEDIGQRKAMEELVSLAKEEAERANRAKSDFLASMSHELKSPVASVLAAARLIEMGGPEPERRAASIIASAQGLLDVLGDILDFVRFETGTGTVRKFTFPLAGFVARICDPHRKEAEAKGLAFELGALPDETLRSDPDRLGRAISALLDNAVTFTDAGRIRVEAAIERKSGNVPHLVLTIADTGIGIAPEDQGRIFSPFVQLASPYTKRGGAGIGLSLARNIVRALGGEIRLQSEAGRGSVFTVLVPVGEPTTSQPAVPPRRRAYRLLVVDDNEVNLEYMATILANAGHRVDRAASGAEALGLLEERPPDAVVLDIQMPGMSGIELGRKVRAFAGKRYDPGLPLVALTAFDPEEVARSGVDFDGVFSKPVDVSKLIAFLDEAVDRREASWTEGLEGGEKELLVLAQAELEEESLLDGMRSAIAAEDEEALRGFARSLGGYFGRLGAERSEAALRRLVLAFPDEDGAVLLCRIDRIADSWKALVERLRIGTVGDLEV